MKDQRSDDSISDDKAAQVLDRAAQLDAARGREVSVQDLREAALEAGISPDAFERALAEVRAAKLERVDPRALSLTWSQAMAGSSQRAEQDESKALLPSILPRAGLFAAGLAIGGLALLLGSLMDDAGIVFSLLIAALVAVAMMIRRRREGGVLSFELDLVMLWLGLTFILMVGNPSSAEDVLANMAGLGTLWALGGGAVVALSPHKRPKELPEET
jgi:hypothetical protein